MPKWLRSAVIFVLAALMLLGLILPAFAQEVSEEDFIGIHTVEELQAMKDNPAGSYRLEADLDMKDVAWEPVDFTGVFDGNGHAILNLDLSQVGTTTAEVFTEYKKSCEAKFAGFFGTLIHAQVRNLKLINVRGVAQSDDPCFMGSIAGYSYESTITNCQVSGVLELRAHNQMHGLGGIVGYGSGKVEGCHVEATLIGVDTNEETEDEQFFGGIYSTGYMDLIGNHVFLQGFVSSHAAVHIGGLAGRYIKQPLGDGKVGTVTHNHVAFAIKYFESARAHRAVCDGLFGEMQVQGYVMNNNTKKLVRDEVRKYDQEIRPCMCENPDIREYTVYSDCKKGKYGHSNWECWTCGYQENFDYMLITHNVTNWQVVEEPTLEKEGLSEGTCDRCGIAQTRVEPVLEPEETVAETVPVVSEESEQVLSEQEEQSLRSKLSVLILILVVAVVLLTAIVGFLVYQLLKDGKTKESE